MRTVYIFNADSDFSKPKTTYVYHTKTYIATPKNLSF